jgi:molecular chaperone GrpE
MDDLENPKIQESSQEAKAQVGDKEAEASMTLQSASPKKAFAAEGLSQEASIAAENIPLENILPENTSDVQIPSSNVDEKGPSLLQNFPQENRSADFEREIQRLREQLLQIHADFDNFRKRSTRDQEEVRRSAYAAIIREILPILDNFEIGLKSAQVDTNILSGFQMIFSQLQALLVQRGVQELAPTNTPFDPLQQEAVAYIDHSEIPQEYVVETVRKGYRFNNDLLRPASVVVSKGQPPEEK